ncbi:phosphate acyltransferase [Algicella marina]|uniref:Phosphate acetyltransferase n=1 Tax=Algicella marina TaxID=2683284 RepID=A0A6P1SWT1_9RHOB|nr:phosphate acyltransferase [Algicella marina]QHQ34898.1 phosphate acetyltransferase [Algicella marina]
MVESGSSLKAIVMPEGEDARIVEAAGLIAARGIARPLVLGAEAVPEGVVALGALKDPAPLVAAMLARRPGKASLAERMLTRPLFRAGAMVAAGQAAAMLAGVAHPTRRVIEAAGLTVGMAEGVATPSSFFLMRVPGRAPLAFADCALNVAPDAAALADIAVATARSAGALLEEPVRLAFLSFSTHGSGAGASVDLVREAVALAGPRLDCAFDGPLQADAALSAAIAAKKGADWAGGANVLIFPTLDAGNIGYKLVQELVGAQAVGPFLQGFAQPVCDLSRGASVADIVDAAEVVLRLA